MAQVGGRSVAAPPDPVAVLQQIAFLGQAPPADAAAVAEGVSWVQVSAGEVLFHQHDDADGLYLVVRGRLECVADGVRLNQVGRGGTLGELALLVNERRSATVRAVRDSLLAFLPAASVSGLLATRPALSLGLARTVARRVVSGPATPEVGFRSAAVVSADAGLEASTLAAEVARRLGAVAPGAAGHRRRSGPLDGRRWHRGGGQCAARSRGPLRPGGRHRPRTHGRAEPRSRRHRARRYRPPSAHRGGAAPDGPGGGGRPVRGRPRPRRDGAGGQRPPPGHTGAGHGASEAAAGTARSLAAAAAHVEVRDHVHVRDDRPADLDRLARILSGQSVGVVLGGGGSRGFAHIGVLRALREAGIPIDRVGGSSMGAIMAAQVASGWTPEQMLERNAAVWSRRGLVEFGLPTLSLLRGRRAVHVLGELFGDRRIEDLWLDYFCTTVDLSSFRLHVARSGPVADWARASATVPGLWPPLVDDGGHLHVDGGGLDNVPTDIMRAGHVGVVIGVDVCHRQSSMALPGPRILPTGLALLRERRRQWVPTIFDVLNRSNLLASLQTHEQAERHADVFLAPPVEDEGFAAFDRIGRLAGLGYRFAVDQLEQADLSALRGTSHLSR